MDIPRFVCSPMDKHLGCFQFGAVVDAAAIKTSFCVDVCFQFFGVGT